MLTAPRCRAVLLTVSMLKLAKTIDGFGGDTNSMDFKLTRTLFDDMKAEEERIQLDTRIRMQIFGMLYKEVRTLPRRLRWWPWWPPGLLR